jgi:PAS domain S-box-containing protein
MSTMSAGLLEAAPDAIIAVSADGLVVLVNAQTERLFGYSRDELVGQPVEILVPEVHRGVHPARREHYLVDPRPRPMGAGMELAGRRKDGTEFPAEISLSVVRADKGPLVAAAVRDVSDSKRADAQFRALLEAAPDAIVGVTGEGLIAMANAQTERLFGYSRDELVGQPVEILVPEVHRGVHPARREHYLVDPRPRPMGAGRELAGRRKDGTEFPAEISLSSLETAEGVLVSAAIRDVTDRVRAEEIRNRLASIVQSSHDAIIGKTLDGVITSWNPGAERLYGYTEEEMIGRRGDMLYPPERAAEESMNLRKITRGERVERYETQQLRKDETLVTVSLSMSPISDVTDHITGIASVSRDISDRQQAEVKFRGLLEASPDAIIGVATDGRIALANGQAERLFGYTRAELIGRPVEVLVPEGLGAAHRAHRAAYFTDPRTRTMGLGMHLTARRRNGSEFPVEISLSALDTDEGVIATAAVRDITDRLESQAEKERLKAQAERERLERQLQQSQRMESLGQLAGGIAHDFNNLLSVIGNYTAFVAEEVAAALPRGQHSEAVRADIDQIRRAVDRAAELTHQLLAFGRREIVRPCVMDLNWVVRDVEQMLRRTLGEHVELVTSLATDLQSVLADPGQLEQVLVNLAVNARDAMPTGGTLTIATANVDLDPAEASTRPGLKPGHHVRLHVNDTGTGMPEEVTRRAFEPFFTTKGKGSGTGLGLATVYGIITQAGGYVAITSAPGAGTLFTILLPSTDETPAETERPLSTVTPAAGGETVLVVEDEPALRDVARRILTRHGYQVITASGGVEAIETLGRYHGPVHLLLTDVIMPQMLGRELVAKITAERPEIRVLYMSGYAHPVLSTQGNLDPDVTLLEKPFTEPVLMERVRQVLDTPIPADGRESTEGIAGMPSLGRGPAAGG